MVIAFLLGTFAYANREAIVLKLVGFAVKRRIPVGPHQEVAWSTGADPQGRARAERPVHDRSLGAEEADRRRAENRGDVHRPAVVRDHRVRALEQRTQLGDVEPPGVGAVARVLLLGHG